MNHLQATLSNFSCVNLVVRTIHIGMNTCVVDNDKMWKNVWFLSLLSERSIFNLTHIIRSLSLMVNVNRDDKNQHILMIFVIHSRLNGLLHLSVIIPGRRCDDTSHLFQKRKNNRKYRLGSFSSPRYVGTQANQWIE